MMGAHDDFDQFLSDAIKHRRLPAAPVDLAQRALSIYAAEVAGADRKMACLLRLRRRNRWVSIAASVLISLVVLAGVWHLAGQGANSWISLSGSSSTTISTTTASASDSTSSLLDSTMVQPLFLLTAVGVVAAVVLLSAAGSRTEQTSACELVLN